MSKACHPKITWGFHFTTPTGTPYEVNNDTIWKSYVIPFKDGILHPHLIKKEKKDYFNREVKIFIE